MVLGCSARVLRYTVRGYCGTVEEYPSYHTQYRTAPRASCSSALPRSCHSLAQYRIRAIALFASSVLHALQHYSLAQYRIHSSSTRYLSTAYTITQYCSRRSTLRQLSTAGAIAQYRAPRSAIR
eukprot:1070303-Rhodomonas_salina.1